VTIEALFYRVLPTYQIYVSHSLYNRTERVNNIMFYVPTLYYLNDDLFVNVQGRAVTKL